MLCVNYEPANIECYSDEIGNHFPNKIFVCVHGDKIWINTEQNQMKQKQSVNKMKAE